MQLLNQSFDFSVMLFLAFRVITPRALWRGVGGEAFIFNRLNILPILPVPLVCQQQLLSQLFFFFIGVASEGMEKSVIVVVQHGVDDGVLQLFGGLAAFKNLEDERFEEVFLLSEVLAIFHVADLEGVHRDGMFLAVTDIRAMEVAADTFIRVAGIDQHDIGVLLYQLAHHGIRRKTLAAAAWT